MPLTKEEVHAKLDGMGIKYETTKHAPVYTIDEMKLIEGMNIEDVCKNLFLRDEKGKRHFLVVLDEAKSADLKSIRAQIGSTRLSFASEERLMDNLGLTKGAVTPLGVLNDCAANVEVLIDGDLRGRPRLGVHPCDNTETLWLSYADLEKIIKSRGNSLKFIKL
ncbi:prolyl-tRNA synthetase associated domain-containing protein [Synergistes jonesii]|uniref:prolyl-tRNA synthetase associated domain-containing protein n=1 Tax=Synergistes jonesii TaxID=2754 RepID=UPI00248D93D4|nr:prolyl-tRNA synthetase associated domain-containing protein [Synergistes jonesii]